MSASVLAKAIFFPQRSAVIFATKGIIAMALSLYVAMYCQLDRPYWALVSAVFLQIRPESGLVIEKGISQISGTLVGGGIGILILNGLMPFPELALPALALWLGIMAYSSAMVRNPNATYAYTMAGVTPIIIVVLTMAQPAATISSHTVFDVAQARMSELIVGSVCATFISLFFWPTHIKDSLHELSRVVVNQTLHYLDHELDEHKTHQERHQALDAILETLAQLNESTSAVQYEGPQGPSIYRAISLLNNKIMSLLAVIQIFGRVKRYHPELDSPFLNEVVRHIRESVCQMKVETDRQVCYQIAKNLRQKLLILKQSTEQPSPIELRLVKVAMEMSADLIVVLTTYQAIFHREGTRLHAPKFQPHRDPWIGFSVALRTVSVFAISSTLWIFTGSSAVILMMILPVIFSMMMARLPLNIVTIVLKRLTISAVVAVGVAIFYALNILAQSSADYILLLMVLAGPYFLGLLALANRPTLPYGLGFCIPFTILTRPGSDMSLSFSIDFALSSGLGIICGSYLLYWLFQIITGPSLKLIQKGVLKATVNDLQSLSCHQENEETRFNARMTDRLLRSIAGEPTPERQRMTDIVLTGLNLGHIILRFSRMLNTLGLNQQTSSYRHWQTVLAEAYGLAAQGRYSEPLQIASEQLLADLQAAGVNEAQIRMVEGMIQRIGFTFDRTAKSINA
ncbi:FUSC family protein [Vibrio spartinae]|uniref:p-hydroxybenzoic acid efflux pump subunit AaeB n=1 Tax=Vibrio spartinae TaxID=1918945 RepID=A0A1N6LZH4_9VIBR|nr:FUSC family protein [Vibrio spartinae]QMV16791.1 p-hydroxybenzoic acid efflux pump subunit AaeB [Vibrio spartinae]SIO92583.1 p-hydroxybenzoic acid efflux pump subunit AaeB [Vibrio spartinae]